MNNKNKLGRLFGETLFHKIAPTLISYTAILLICSLVIVLLTDLKPNQTEPDIKLITLDKVQNIPEESLYIEWLGNKGYDADKRTMILVHGETPEKWDSKFSMTLNQTDYVYYAENSSYYNIDTGADIDRLLYKYWLDQDYNVGVFHYEKFADDTMEMLSKKLYNNVNMRFRTEDGFNSAKTPNYSLTEILAAVYLNEIPVEAYGNEIRLIGNGIGANLALSLCDYLYSFYQRDKIRPEILPQRLSLIDPYLSAEKFDNAISWRKIPTSQSILDLTDKMLNYTTENGLVCDMVESVEVTAVTENGTSVEKLVHPYDYVLNEQSEEIKDNIKDKTAYLLLRQKYAVLYSDNYKKQNRAGLDWYLYSIIGSDDDRVGSPSYTNPDYDSSYCNWGRHNTRPILNDRARTNMSSSGKNYAVSAWTETVWIRALRGIKFEMKQSTGQQKDNADPPNYIRDIHDNYVYDYKDYNLTKFRSENYQVAKDMKRTIVAGYVWNDKNEDRKMNEGLGCYLSGITINVSLTRTVSGETETVETLSVVTGKDGFYKIEFSRSFKDSHSVNLTVVHPNSSYHAQTAAMTTYHVEDISKHTFNKNSKSLTISKSYGYAITMASCGLVIK